MKKIFGAIGGFFSRVFGKGRVKEYATAAIKVVEVLKLLIESPLITYGTAITPTPVDDLLVRKAKEYLPWALKSLEFVKGLDGRTALQIVTSVAEQIAKIPPAERGPAYQKVAALIVQVLADNKVSITEALAVVELAYAEFKYKVNG